MTGAVGASAVAALIATASSFTVRGSFVIESPYRLAYPAYHPTFQANHTTASSRIRIVTAVQAAKAVAKWPSPKYRQVYQWL